jgi:glycerol-1-phosphate dehydrogenase [NAD(P)+]
MIIDSSRYNGPCSCGHDHTMVTKLAVIESGCLREFDSYLQKYGLTGKRTVIYDKNTRHAAGLIAPRADFEIVLDPENLHANEVSTDLVLKKLNPETEVLIAAGSGTIHDITRFCANKLGLPFVSCPTAATVDGFCSTVSAMTWYGFKKTMPGVAPVLVLADLDIISQAPKHLALSGVGDIIGKYTALADWEIAHLLTGEYICGRIEDMTMKAVKEVHESAEKLESGDRSAYEQLTYGLILSGLAMQMMGNSRPASGAEHHISHFIEMKPEGLGISSDAMHGEKVGVGTLLAIREYRHLAETEDIAPFVHAMKPVTEERILPVFGNSLTPVILEENKKDVTEGLTADKLTASWDDVRKIIFALPEYHELFSFYEKIGMKKTLSDIGVPEKVSPKLLMYSPFVRARLTFMRIRQMIDIPYTE